MTQEQLSSTTDQAASNGLWTTDIEATLKKHKGKWVFFNHNGEVINQKGYDDISDFCEGMARVSKRGKIGFIDASGNEVVSPKYERAGDFWEGMSCVMLDGKYGFIDKEGREVIDCKYDDAADFRYGMASVRNSEGKYGFVDKEGREVVSCVYDFVDEYFFEDRFARIKNSEGKYGFIDKQGREVVPCKFFYASPFSDGMACVGNKSHKYGFIDTDGRLVIPFNYVNVGDFSEGLAWVVRRFIESEWGTDQHYGYIDKQGRCVVPCRNYTQARGFHDGVAVVYDHKKKKYGAIGTDGKTVVPFEYDSLFDFEDGVAKAEIDGEWMLINKEGKIVSYIDIHLNFFEGMAIVVDEEEERYGYVNSDGELVIPCIYDDADPFHEGVACVCKDGLYGFIDKTGKPVIPCEYNRHLKLDYDSQGVFNQEEWLEMCYGMALLSRGDNYVLIDHRGNLLAEFSTDIRVHRMDGMIAMKLQKN